MEIMTTKEIEYTKYIDNHISNIKQVWKDIQPLLVGYNWLDDFMHFTIDKLIEVHDISKYCIEEFEGYRQWFYPEAGMDKSESEFKYAWNHHQKTNQHHWQYWVMVENKEIKSLKIPFIYIFEMLCDWTAMSYKFNDLPSEFYNKNKDDMILEETTTMCIENWLPLFDQLVKNRN